MRIVETEFAQRIGTTVILKLRDKDGKFRKHYHRYKSEDKAEIMYQIYKKAIEEEQ